MKDKFIVCNFQNDKKFFWLPLLATQEDMKLTAGLRTSGCRGDAPPIKLKAAGRSCEHTHWFNSNGGEGGTK